MSQFCSSEQIEKYFSAPTRSERLDYLASFRSKGLKFPLSMTQEAFALRLSNLEYIALLEITQPDNKEEFELWVFENLLNWPQDVAAIALRTWCQVTDKLLWHRLIPLLKMPVLPQRLHYTIIDIAMKTNGSAILDVVLAMPGWEDFSNAYHGLLFDRSIEFSCKSDRLTALAIKILHQNSNSIYSDDKSLNSAITWLMYEGKTKLVETQLQLQPSAVWKSFARSALEKHACAKKDLEKTNKSLIKQAEAHKSTTALTDYPEPWSRHSITVEFLKLVVNSEKLDPQRFEKILYGVERKTIELLKLEPSQGGDLLTGIFNKFLPIEKSNNTLLNEERSELLSPRGVYGQFKIKKSEELQQSSVTSNLDKSSRDANLSRAMFFAASCSGQNSSITNGSGFWDLLSEAWNSKDNGVLGRLVVEARKQKGLANIAYLTTLGRFKSSDEAVLKIMDHIRTTEEDELRVIVNTLGEIDSSRSLLELISILTRPNVTTAIQQEAASILRKKDLKHLQKELRAAIQDLKVPQDPGSPIAEVKEVLESLLVPGSADESSKVVSFSAGKQKTTIDDKALDVELNKIIPHYTELSSEVRKALRTALFFNISISGNESTHAIDLSPLIDMQYKAMELLFRESFEDFVSYALQKGDIPRKLDVIGYARPIPQKMDEFEGYIATLPVVKEIPFFSKFKLRKMLRAICQFEPGRRFTLDGLKAFGLFFLCFSRKNCKFGLNSMVEIGMKDDRELAEFAKELHVFQDFRNRAAHEGFHPQASNDLQGIWRSTASIVQNTFKIREALDRQQTQRRAATPRAS